MSQSPAAHKSFRKSRTIAEKKIKAFGLYVPFSGKGIGINLALRIVNAHVVIIGYTLERYKIRLEISYQLGWKSRNPGL